MRSTTACRCGLLAAVTALLTPVLGAGFAATPYSHVAQYISELGARGTPHGAVVSIAGFGATGVLVAAFLWSARPFYPPLVRATAGAVAFAGVSLAYLGAAVFRCDPGCPSEGSLSQSIHSSTGLIEYVGATAGLLLLASAFRASPDWRRAAAASSMAAIVVAIGFLGMLQPGLQSWRGLSQRIAEAAIFLWIAGVSVLLRRAERKPASAAPSATGNV